MKSLVWLQVNYYRRLRGCSSLGNPSERIYPLRIYQQVMAVDAETSAASTSSILKPMFRPKW